MNTVERDRDRDRTLGVLQAVEQESALTQRGLAARLDVALGLANAYLKRCVRKGLVKVQQAPANRYLYYLTPQGFSEKSRLTALYLRDSFDFYRRASESLHDVFAACESDGFCNLVFAGASELAEIGLVRAREYPVTVRAIFDPAQRGNRYLDLPLWHTLHGHLDDIDAWVLTGINAPESVYAHLRDSIPAHRILVPEILGLNPGNGSVVS